MKEFIVKMIAFIIVFMPAFGFGILFIAFADLLNCEGYISDSIHFIAIITICVAAAIYCIKGYNTFTKE